MPLYYPPPITDHGALSGLSDDDHTQYALLAGRAGGQTLQPDSATTVGNLTLVGNLIPSPSDTLNLGSASVLWSGVYALSFHAGTRFRATFAGSAAAPNYTWTTDLDTGLYSVGADIFGVTVGGVEALRITEAAGVHTFLLTGDTINTGNLRVGSSVAPTVELDVAGKTILTADVVGDEVLRLISVATKDDPIDQFFHGRVATSNATVTTINTIAITQDRTYLVEARVRARRTGGTAGTADDAAAYIVRGTYKVAAGTVTLVGAVTVDYSAEDQAGWDATLTISGANVLVQVMGALNNNVVWHSTVLVNFVGL